MKEYLSRMFKLAALTIFILGFNYAGQEAFAGILAGGLKTFEVMPYRIISVKGDAAKFRALNWMNDGTTGGINDMSYDGKIGKDSQLSFEGHVIPGDNDFGASLKLIRGNGSYMTVDYGNFRKWYEVYGGFYSNFTGQPITKLTFEPAMDMGHFFFEIGSGTENDPGVALSYERDTKDGKKNMLTWGSVVQEGRTRKILPAWQETDTTTDAVTLKGNADVAGFNVKGQQRAEFFSGRIFREDNSTTTSFQSHAQEPQAKRLVSSLKADRWTVDDKTYVAFAYQFQHLRHDMADTMRVYNTAGTTTSSASNRITDAKASRDSHAWVEHFVTDLTSDLSLVTKLKQEIVAASGSGYAAGYTPGGNDRSVESENRIIRTGEGVSLRYNGLPKTSLYTDWDFQQTRNWQSKIRIGSSYTENLDEGPEITGVMGARYVHNEKVNMTSQLRHRSKHDTYDTFFNNHPGMAISRLRTESDEWNNRLTWKPTKWLQNSFRLQLADTVYSVQTSPQYVVDNDWIKSNANSKIYTYDLTLQPWDEWMFNVGASLNQFKVSTPASQKTVSSGGIPVFTSNVHTLLFLTSYAPKENLSFYSSAQYSRAENFEAQNFSGLPYGLNNEHYDIALGMKWAPKKNITLEPRYAYYSFRSSPDGDLSLDYGNYSAHVLWLDAKFNW